MAELIIHSSNFDFKSDNDHKENVHFYMDDPNAFYEDVKGKKVLFLCEPDVITNITDLTIENSDKVDHILTHDDKVLQHCDNAHLFEFGTCWVDEDVKRNSIDLNDINKEFSVSHVVGHKNFTKGHQLRQKVWYKQKKIKTPKKFYLSKYNEGVENFVNAPILGDTKYPLFNSMFHIAIENCRIGYYFSEKIIDAFRTYTVPIYWGCSNIERYFDTEGIIIFEDIKDLIKKVNSLKQEDYYNRMKAIKDNFELSKKYWTINDRLNYKIKELTK